MNIRKGLQQLGVAAVRKAIPALDTVGQERTYTSCFLCYALHGCEVAANSVEHEAVRTFYYSLPLEAQVLSGLHFGGTAAMAQELRDEVTLFLAEHGDAPEPHIAPEAAVHAI